MDKDPGKGFWHNFLNFFKKSESPTTSTEIEEQIQELVDSGELKGIISPEEGDMIHGIFSFKDTIAREIMVPRTDTTFASHDIPLLELIDIIIEKGYTRIPIYKGTIDNIIGILYAKDLLPYWGQNNINIEKIIRPVTFIPESKRISELFDELRNRKSHMVVIIDEYGGMSGIITIEDILEEIVGEIQDEYDKEENMVVRVNDNTIIVDARLNIEGLKEHIDVKFPEDIGCDSIGGFITHLVGKIPKPNEIVSFENLDITILKADSRKIDKVKIDIISKSEETDS